jgi:hypothetical protein
MTTSTPGMTTFIPRRKTSTPRYDDVRLPYDRHRNAPFSNKSLRHKPTFLRPYGVARRVLSGLTRKGTDSMGERKIIVRRKPVHTTSRRMAEVRVERASLRPPAKGVDPLDAPTMEVELEVEIGWLESDDAAARMRILDQPAIPPRRPQEPPPLTATKPRNGDARASRRPGRKDHALTNVPTVVVVRDALRRQPLDPGAAFLLSLMDGVTPLEAILDLCGMPRDVALSIFDALVKSGIVDAGHGRPRASRRPPRSK